MTTTATSPPIHLGFLTILNGESGTLGGYLVTNLWGRPLEFRLSNAIRPTKVQQILYGPTLRIYLGAELIGKALVNKTSTPVQLVLTDQREALELRRQLDVPVVWVAPKGDAEAEQLAAEDLAIRQSGPSHGPILTHPEFAEDVSVCTELFRRIGTRLDAAEPFTRLREAIVEARKLGASYRVAS